MLKNHMKKSLILFISQFGLRANVFFMKINRIKYFNILFLSIILFSCKHTIPIQNHNLTSYVNPFIGTGGHGHTYPGATLPFGMVQLSPDTRLEGWDGCSGYHYDDTVIYGFSHTHLSGTGVSDYADILLMPTIGKPLLNNGSRKGVNLGYASSFLHSDEEAHPGYYKVLLKDYNIQVELTATKRAGFHKYTFPKSKQSNIIIDLEHRDQVLESQLSIINNDEIVGMRRSKTWADDQHVYFVAKFSKPFKHTGIAINDSIISGLKAAEGTNIKAYISFETKDNEVVYVKLGISAVSIKNARENLDMEIPDWDFDNINEKANAEWNQELNRIIVKGGSKEQKRIFYTALYHSMLAPNLYSDVNGEYRGRDLKVHELRENKDYFTVFSLWDTYRASHPLYTIIQQKRTNDFINTFLKQYQYDSLLPVWELAGNETNCMIGYHAVPVIVDAYLKGIRDYDVDLAYEAVKASSLQDKFGLKSYKEKAYIPASEESESVSKTLEYAYDDWCISRFAKELGKDVDYQIYSERAQYYKNIFDASTGFMRAKLNESFFSPFDPSEVNFNYTEANAWQYSFYVPQDISGLVKLYGGKEKLANMLDSMFTTSSETTGREQADITGLIGQYAHGNEPSHHMAYLYNYLGQPWKTQKYVKQIVDKMYSDEPDGLIGNEDCGQMSAWYVFSAAGFYPVVPGSDYYVIGTPTFELTTFQLENGKSFTVNANNISDENIYIQSVKLRGKDYPKSYLLHEDIMKGGTLTLNMGNEPSQIFGIKDEDIPTTKIIDHIILPVPYVSKGDRVFTQSTIVEISSVEEKVEIRYTIDGTEPNENSSLYKEPIVISETTELKARAFKKDYVSSKIITSKFSKIPKGKSIKLNTNYANQYSAGGNMALIDYIHGSANYRTGAWQGYEGINLNAIVDLGKVKSLNKISTSFLQDIGSWIFMPHEVQYYISNDGKIFKHISSVYNNISENDGQIRTKDFTVQLKNCQARYIKVIGVNKELCPDWHKGAGNEAWIFVDEIVIN